MRSRIVIIVIFVLFTTALAQTPSANKPTLANGTTFDARLLKSIDVTKAKVGDKVVLENLHPLQVGDTAAPYGSRLTGKILSIKCVPKNQKGEAELALQSRCLSKVPNADSSAAALELVPSDKFPDSGTASQEEHTPR